MRRHDNIVKVFATIIHSVTGARVEVEKRTDELRHMFKGRLQEGQMDLIATTLNGQPTYIDVAIVSPVVADPHHIARAAKKPGYAAMRAEYGKRQRYPNTQHRTFCLGAGRAARPKCPTIHTGALPARGRHKGAVDRRRLVDHLLHATLIHLTPTQQNHTTTPTAATRYLPHNTRPTHSRYPNTTPARTHAAAHGACRHLPIHPVSV